MPRPPNAASIGLASVSLLGSGSPQAGHNAPLQPCRPATQRSHRSREAEPDLTAAMQTGAAMSIGNSHRRANSEANARSAEPDSHAPSVKWGFCTMSGSSGLQEGRSAFRRFDGRSRSRPGRAHCWTPGAFNVRARVGGIGRFCSSRSIGGCGSCWRGWSSHDGVRSPSRSPGWPSWCLCPLSF